MFVCSTSRKHEAMQRELVRTVTSLTALAVLLMGTARAQTMTMTADGRCFYPFAYWRAGSPSMLPSFEVGQVFWSVCLAHAVVGRAAAPDDLKLAGSDHTIRPGDLLMTRWPGKPGEAPVVRRLIAVPGDRVRVTRGVVRLNGVDVARERQPDWPDTEYGVRVSFQRWRETLPDGATYDVVRHPNRELGAIDNTGEVVVPPGSLYVLGDNRDNSLDTRLPEFGFVRYRDVIGVVAQGDPGLEHAVADELKRQGLSGRVLVPPHQGGRAG